MIEQSTDGLLFFRGGRGVYPCIARNLTKSNAGMYSYGLGLLPVYFYVTFDNFRTIGRCRLIWRYRDDFGVAFERWINLRAQGSASDSES